MIRGLEFVISGILLGLVAGASPGPLFALIFSETLRRGKREGVKIAISPLITDLPIFLFVFLVLSNLMQHEFVVGAISLFGACYLIYLGSRNLRAASYKYEGELAGDALRKGVITNFLNPTPYLFWLSIGGTTIFKSLESNVSLTILFILGFYGVFIGSNLVIVHLVDKSKALVKSKHYLYIIRALGIILIFFALTLIIDGLRLTGLL